MDAKVRELLAGLERFGRENDAKETERAKKMLNLEPETAQLLSILVRSGGARRVLEIGTSNGYSTIWLASAAAETGGQVISVDRSIAKHAQARKNLLRAGLADHVALILAEATEAVRDLAGPWDFVFFDGDRVTAPQQLELLVPKLSACTLIAADNALSHPDEIKDYLQAISGTEGFMHMVLPVGKGLSLAYRGARPAAQAASG
jgi:predicted O-methyltransferase YrrM